MIVLGSLSLSQLLPLSLLPLAAAWEWELSTGVLQCNDATMGVFPDKASPTDGSTYHLLFVPVSEWNPMLSVFQLNFPDNAGLYYVSTRIVWPANTEYVVVVSMISV